MTNDHTVDGVWDSAMPSSDHPSLDQRLPRCKIELIGAAYFRLEPVPDADADLVISGWTGGRARPRPDVVASWSALFTPGLDAPT